MTLSCQRQRQLTTTAYGKSRKRQTMALILRLARHCVFSNKMPFRVFGVWAFCVAALKRKPIRQPSVRSQTEAQTDQGVSQSVTQRARREGQRKSRRPLLSCGASSENCIRQSGSVASDSGRTRANKVHAQMTKRILLGRCSLV